jgi:hypothetical protein
MPADCRASDVVEERAMITKQAIRCKFGHHNWGPILGDIEHARHECEECGAVKPILVTSPPRDPTGSGGGGEGPSFI